MPGQPLPRSCPKENAFFSRAASARHILQLALCVCLSACSKTPPPSAPPPKPRSSPDACFDLADCRQHCAEQKLAACERLVGFAENESPQAVLEHLELACGVGHAKACEAAAAQLAESEDPKAIELAERACNLDSPKACTTFASFLAQGTLMPEDQGSAFELHKRACEAGSAASCNEVGAAYAAGNVVSADPEQAAENYQKACDGDHAPACNNFAQVLLTGQGVWPDAARAVKLAQRACESSGRLCVTLADLYEEGTVIAQDKQRARALYERACQADPKNSCLELWLFMLEHGNRQDMGQAVPKLAEACEAGSAIACNRVGHAYSTGTGVAADSESAEKYFGLACTTERLCEGLADLIQNNEARPAEESVVLDLLRKGCFEGGQWSACFKLGTPEAVDHGLKQAEPECVAGDQEVCELIRAQRLK